MRKAMNIICGILAELCALAVIFLGAYLAYDAKASSLDQSYVSHRQEQVSHRKIHKATPGKTATMRHTDPPAEAEPGDGELFAYLRVPSWGKQYRLPVWQGTAKTVLDEMGAGHYDTTAMPGQVGNFAFAGHRNGYGQPLGDVDKLQEGDPIIIRTQDYWYVYHYTSYKIVLPTQTEVVAANPENPGAAPTKRMLTMTTCEPKYSTPTHRWISYAEFSYWAKVADGIPQELASQNANGTVKFVNNEQSSFLSSIDTLKPWIFGALAAYVIIFISAAVAWQWPYLADVRAGRRKKADFSLYGSLVRLQPGVLPIRLLLVLLLVFAAAASCFEWLFPWAASTIPMLQEMSNYTAI